MALVRGKFFFNSILRQKKFPKLIQNTASTAGFILESKLHTKSNNLNLNPNETVKVNFRTLTDATGLNDDYFKKNKSNCFVEICETAEEAVRDIQSGARILAGGFG